MIEKKWLAGFLDGDGSIQLRRHNRSDMNYPSYRPTITLTNRDRKVLREIQEKYGGSVVENSNAAMNSNWKHAWTLTMTFRKARNLLFDVLPYLKIKKPQAILLSKFMYYTDSLIQRRPRSVADIEIREKFVNQMANINRRGLKRQTNR